MNGLQDSHLIVAVMTAYAMGLIACLTPCVYPLIPITLSLFGASHESNRWRSFLLSFCYVCGIAVTYTTLGIVTVKLGMVFGTLLGNPMVVIPICAVLFLLALHSLGLLNLPLDALQSKANGIGGAGRVGAFFMGAVSGGVAAPCVGPVLAILLVEVAQSHNLVRSVLMLLGYSFGLGTPFLILGTYSSLLRSMPKSGNWLHYVKFLIAACIFAEIFFLLNSLTGNGILPSDPRIVWFVLLAISITASWITIKRSHHKLQIISAALLALATIQIVVPVRAQNGTDQFQWMDNQTTASDLARQNKKILMIDLSAKWCMACKELEHTFADPAVTAKIQSTIIPVRLDFTAETPATEEFSAKYGVVGLPCILFLDADGNEIAHSRITGKVSPTEFLEHLNTIQG